MLKHIANYIISSHIKIIFYMGITKFILILRKISVIFLYDTWTILLLVIMLTIFLNYELLFSYDISLF